MGKRGELTQEIKDKSRGLLGYEIDVRELRLMPYIQYVMMNEQRIDPKHINAEEREILSCWRSAGHISGGASGMEITRQFWDIMNEILWMSYVDISE